MRPLVWFRTDLRLHDNPALASAVAAADQGVVAVFAVCPGQWRDHDLADVRVDFVRRTLGELSTSLADLDIALRIVSVDTYDDVPGALVRLAEATDCDALHFNAAYEVNEAARDQAVSAAFQRAGRSVHITHDQCIVEPGRVRTGTGGPYTVFTPFKKNMLGRLRDDGLPDVQPTPAGRREMVGTPDVIPDSIPGFEPPPKLQRELWPAGEAEARRRLDAFAAHRMDDYKDTRDLAADDATSRLSPYLAVGAISVRHCLQVAAEANDGRLLDGREGLVTWISELVWRDFYRHVMVAFPRVSKHRAFKEKTEALDWRADDDAFEAWCAGRTGYPIVDAGMRQLLEEGWMHNRLRMITAMFLTKDLFIDWRRGERHFMRHLVDGDLASNNGGWQWSASTGTDAQPYFRIFNPITQGQRYDADGAYIRRWVPELTDLTGKAVHEPWKRDSLFDERDGYPRPIVDHSAARDRVLAAFKSLP